MGIAAFVSGEIAGLDALDELEAVFEMCWNVFQHWFKGVGEQP